MYYVCISKTPNPYEYTYGIIHPSTNQSLFSDNLVECVNDITTRSQYSDNNEDIHAFTKRTMQSSVYSVTLHPTLDHIRTTYLELLI